MTITLLESQKERIGRLVWENIDGVARNVMPMLQALNNDPTSGIRVVTRDEWDRCLERIHELQRTVTQLEQRAADYTREHVSEPVRKALAR